MLDRGNASTDLGFSPGGLFLAALDAVIVMDLDGVVQDFNPAAEEAFGYSAEEAVGQDLAELLIPPAARHAHRAGLERYRATGQARMMGARREVAALHRDGTEFPVELAITRIPNVEPPLFAGFIRRLDEAGAVKLARLKAQQRTTFLAAAGLVLDRSLDLHQTLRGLAELTVPELAHLTVIDLVGDDGAVSTAVAAAREPQQGHALEVVRASSPLDPNSDHPVAEVLRTRRSMLLPEMGTAFLRKIATSDEHFELMSRLGYRSAIVVPLSARGRLLGALSLLRMHDERSYDEEDLILAEELARRAAFAVDNARLFEATRRLARTLQESLLPRFMPTIPGVRITPSYRAAQEGQDVGGDFYDAFTIAEGRFGIAIGDVTGKGAQAAALTAQARHTIRAVAGAGALPGRVLSFLNDAVLRDSQPLRPRFLTALFAVAEPQENGLRLELAAAAHPPPLIRRAGGAVEVVTVDGPLIGVDPGSTYASRTLTLGPGETLLLYTDGLTDARAPRHIISEGELARMLREAQDVNGSELAQALERAAIAGERPRDDIAMLLVEVEHE